MEKRDTYSSLAMCPFGSTQLLMHRLIPINPRNIVFKTLPMRKESFPKLYCMYVGIFYIRLKKLRSK